MEFTTKRWVINTLLYFAYLLLPYFYLKEKYPEYEERYGLDKLKIYFPLSIQLPSLAICFLFFGSLYHFEIPFFEKYKDNALPWMWNKDEKSWKVLKRKLIWVYCRNLFLIAPFLNILVSRFTQPLTSAADFPSL